MGILLFILGLGAVGFILSGCGSGNDGDAGTDVAPETIQEGTYVPAADTTLPPTAPTPGVSDQRILFGQSAAFSGPAQELGKGMQLGIEAAFHEVNQQGGVHGRILELVSLDDTYEPELAIANTLSLINNEQVFALIGEVGTPTSRSVTPVAADAGIPYVAPFTGAAFLRDEAWNNIVNLRASYAQETEEMVERLTTDLGIERIAIMYQDDSFGRTGYQGALAALRRREMKPVAVGLYPRNTTAVKTGLVDLKLGEPEAVIAVGAYEPVAALIAWARYTVQYTGFDPVFVTISFVGSNALAEELGPSGEGVFVTQVVPFPTDDSLPVVAAYLQALSAYAPDAVPGFVSLEGYLAGRLAIAGLENCEPDVSRTCFLDSLLKAEAIDIEGFRLSYGAGDNQGSDQVFLTVIGEDGRYRPTDTMRVK